MTPGAVPASHSLPLPPGADILLPALALPSPPAVADKDVIGLAQTGSGKTGAFALPILQVQPGHGDGVVLIAFRRCTGCLRRRCCSAVDCTSLCVLLLCAACAPALPS